MRHHARGQSMLEVIIAIAVMVIGISAAAALMTATERSTAEMVIQLQAAALAEEGIHATISIGDRSWTDLSLGTHGLAVGTLPAQWNFSGSSDSANGFTRTVTVSSVNANTKKIVVLVSWHPTPGRTASVEEQMLFTNWAFII